MPGNAPDIVARLIASVALRAAQPEFIIDNRPGRGHQFGTEAAVRAPADGYTLLYATTANAISASVFQRLNFNFIRDISPVAGIIRVPNLVSVNLSLPVKTIPELIAYARANPGKLNFGANNGGHGPALGRAVQDDDRPSTSSHVPYSNADAGGYRPNRRQMQVISTPCLQPSNTPGP